MNDQAPTSAGFRGTVVGVEQVPSVKHWDSARQLVSSEPPTPDDVPTTLSGEPLETEGKIREFLASVNAARAV